MGNSNIAEAILAALNSAEADSARQTANGHYTSESLGSFYRRSDRARGFIACLSGRLTADEPELAAQLMEFLCDGSASPAKPEGQ